MAEKTRLFGRRRKQAVKGGEKWRSETARRVSFGGFLSCKVVTGTVCGVPPSEELTKNANFRHKKNVDFSTSIVYNVVRNPTTGE